MARSRAPAAALTLESQVTAPMSRVSEALQLAKPSAAAPDWPVAASQNQMPSLN
jgi:hypothetical protein